MEVRFKLNGKQVSAEVSGDTILLDVLRNLGCYSVKCGCETTNCGLCTVWINGKSRLSCSILAAGIEGQEVTTLEGLKEEAEEFGAFLAQEGAEQCGFCSPGFIMNVLAMVRELENPTIEEMKEYLSGNLCRCTGYMGQLRAIRKYMAVKRLDIEESEFKKSSEDIYKSAGNRRYIYKNNIFAMFTDKEEFSCNEILKNIKIG